MNKDLIINTGVLPEFLSGENSLQKIGGSKPGTGAKVVSGVIIAALVGGGGWAFIKFALPAIMAIISPVIAGVISFFAVLLGISLVKPAWKWFTAISNKLYKAAIRYNPEVAVENKLRSFDDMIRIFRDALAEIKKAAASFKELARKSEKDNVEIKSRLEEAKAKLIELEQKKAVLLQQRATLQAEIDSGKRKTQKEREPYYDAGRELTEVHKEIDRLASECKSYPTVYKMNTDLVQKYAAKAHIFSDWESFLDRGANQIDNKKRELKVWWEAIKKEISVANAGKKATNALQFILRDVNGNQYDFNLATEYIIEKINTDYSITVQNIDDLRRHVDGLDFKSEDALNDLEKLLRGIESGEIETPSAIEISSPVHKLTSTERSAAGVLGDLF